MTDVGANAPGLAPFNSMGWRSGRVGVCVRVAVGAFSVGIELTHPRGPSVNSSGPFP